MNNSSTNNIYVCIYEKLVKIMDFSEKLFHAFMIKFVSYRKRKINKIIL